MRRVQHIVASFAIFLVLVGMVACSGEDCPINNTVMGKMAFYDQYGEATGIGVILTVSAVRPQGDSVVLNQQYGSSEVLFPLSYAHATDTFVFCYVNSQYVAYDSIYISHTNTPTLVSVDCGTAMYHTITSVSSTSHLIESITLKSSEVNYDERENIQVAYRLAD